MKVKEAAVAVPGVSVSKGKGMALFFGFSLGSCGVAEGCGRAFVGLRVGHGVGEGCCVAILGVAGLCFPGVGSPSQTQMVQAGMSGLHMALAPGKNSGHVVRLCLSAAPQLGEAPAHPPVLHRSHGSGVGSRPLLLLPDPQQLGGKVSLSLSFCPSSSHIVFPS